MSRVSISQHRSSVHHVYNDFPINFRFVKLNHHYHIINASFSGRQTVCLPYSVLYCLRTLVVVIALQALALLAKDTAVVVLHLVYLLGPQTPDSMGNSRPLGLRNLCRARYLAAPMNVISADLSYFVDLSQDTASMTAVRTFSASLGPILGLILVKHSLTKSMP